MHINTTLSHILDNLANNVHYNTQYATMWRHVPKIWHRQKSAWVGTQKPARLAKIHGKNL